MSPRSHAVLTLLLSRLCLVHVCIAAALSSQGILHSSSICKRPEYLENDFILSDWTLWPASLSNEPCEGGNQHQHPTVVGNDTPTTTTQDQADLSGKSLNGTLARNVRRQPAENGTSLDLRPTPQPTGNPTHATTVHITSNTDFALLLPGTARGMYLPLSMPSNPIPTL